MRHRWFAFASLLGLLAGCGGVPVSIRTPQPLEVDVTLRVDIFQNRTEEPGGATITPSPDAEAAAPTSERGTSDEETRRRERMSQIQGFKNSRIVGENRFGLLTIVRPPAGAYGQQVERTVAAENADRTALMRAEATARRVPLATVEQEQAAQWRERAFPGEWIEVQQANKTWQWEQKQGEQPPPVTIEPPP
jgi:hypothetical protein